jgi:2-phospho-L-lactate/phosphoenolpyruvate guanylyltransferase
MRTLAILPVKSFDAAKQRLGALLGPGSRDALAQAMFADVLASLRRSERIAAIAIVTADPAAAARARDERVVVLDDPSPAGQSTAAGLGIGYADQRAFERVLLVPGDAPLLDPAEVDQLLAEAAADRLAVAIVADRHGEGTNALAIAPPRAFAPSFGPGSLARHVAAAESAGLAHRVVPCPSLALDVDTPEDLATMWTRLDDNRLVAPRTRGALRQLDRARGQASASIAELRSRLSAEELDAWTQR